ncbi:MAG TPA: hypothetical protein VHL53_05415, partial [Acidimicrobiia bacterium]|nr:hypothetical protein [Acidimicrobiia bacterium]
LAAPPGGSRAATGPAPGGGPAPAGTGPPAGQFDVALSELRSDGPGIEGAGHRSHDATRSG